MELFSEATRRDPYPIYARMPPVLHVPEADAWAVFGYDAVKRVLSEHATFSSRVNDFGWLLFMDPPRHTELRSLITRAFTSRAIAALEPRIRALATMLVDRFAERGEVELVGELATPLPMMVIAELLGLPIDDWPQLARWSETIINLGNTIAGGDADRAIREFTAANAAMIEYFARAPRRGLFGRLVDEGLPERELVRFCQLLLAAGTETTTNLIDNAVLCLIAHPDQLARVCADLALLPAAIEETLRYRTPVQAMFRTPARDLELAGTQIPAGKLVLAMLGAANRDPSQFADAAAFSIDRAPNPHLAFGHGIHFCLGAPLARMEARIALTELFARCGDLELVTPEWPPRGSFHVLGPAALPLRFSPKPR